VLLVSSSRDHTTIASPTTTEEYYKMPDNDFILCFKINAPSRIVLLLINVEEHAYVR